MWRWIRRLLAVTSGIAIVSCLSLAIAYLLLSRTNSQIISSGETRHFELYVPDSHDASLPTALVISLHGAWLYPGMQKRLTGWNRLADAQGFIVAYPRATGFPRTWRLTPESGLGTEIRFFSDLIDELSSRYNIDPARILVNGYSNGAAMTFMLSCTMADRFAGYGMVATPVLPWNGCERQRAAPMLAFHGTADRFVPYRGGENFLTTTPLPSLMSWFSHWGERNRCEQAPITTTLKDHVEVHVFDECAGGVPTRLYTLHGSGHIWPGGLKLPEFGIGPYTDAVDASREMWEQLGARTSITRPSP